MPVGADAYGRAVVKGFPDLPPIWFGLSIALIWGLSAIFPDVSQPPVMLIRFGWLVSSLGIGLILWAAFWFFRRRTTIEPHHTPKKMLVEGPFRFTRNPIYLGLVVVAIGSAVGHGVLVGILPVTLLVYVLHVRFVVPEERVLLTQFGDAAQDFISNTRRWL